MRNLTAAITFFSLLAGTLLTLWGLAHMPWPQALPWWGADALIRYMAFVFVCAMLVVGGSWWIRKNPLLIGSAIAAGMALFSGALWPLLVTLWFAVASALLGKFILIGLRFRLKGDSWLTNFLVGAGVYGTVVGLLAHLPVNYPGVYGAALALPLILGWRVVVEEGRRILAWFSQADHLTGLGINWLDVAIAVVALVYVAVAFMPEVGHDPLAMHLFIPAHLALNYQWGFDVSTYVWAVMPMLGDWIFAIGYMLGGETAVRLINVGFILVLGWLVRDLVLWAGGSIVGARWAALIFLSTPLTFTVGSSLFIESVWTAFVVAGTLVVLRSCSTLGIPRFDIPLAGILLGCALAAKAVTLPILPVLLVLLAWRYKSWFRAVGLPSLLISVALFTMIGLIPYVTAWWLTTNPVFPFFNNVFQSSYYPAVNFDSSSIFGKGLTLDFLYRATFESGKYLEAKSGASGFQWLLLFVPSAIVLVAARNRRGIEMLLVGALTIVLVFQSVSYFRYVFPAWAIISAAIGVALSTALSGRAFFRKWVYAAAAVAVTLNLLFLNAGAQYGDFPIKSIGGESNRENYLLNRLPIRPAVELVNRLNVGRTPVGVFSHPMTAGLSADALYANWYNFVFQREITSIQTEQDVADVLLKRGVDFVILDSNWNGVGGVKGPETRTLIEKVTEKLADYGSISVRKIKSDYQFKTELLSNSDFTSISGWILAPGAIYDADRGVMLTDVAKPATQVVAVSPGRRYLNAVVARCAKEPTFGRVQINWLDAKGRFVSTNIKTFECSPTWAEHTMEVSAPPNSANAVVYASGHSSIPLEFKSNSLRQ